MGAKLLYFVPVGIAAAFFGLAIGGMYRDDPDALPSTLEGRIAPAVELAQLGPDAPFTDADLQGGGVKLVNYWASWCAPCRLEHPMLVEIQKAGVPIYGINYKDEPDKALGFLAELGNPYAAVGADDTGRTAINWGVYGVPETYVIDGEGSVHLRFAGPITEDIYRTRILPAIEAAGG